MKNNNGQAMIILILISAITLSIIVEITTIGLTALSLNNEHYNGQILLTTAEGCVENAALRYLRDPNYAGESLQLNSISCTIQIEDLNPGKDLICSCTDNLRQKKVGLSVNLNQGVYDFSPISIRN